MNKTIKLLLIGLVASTLILSVAGCDYSQSASQQDSNKQVDISNKLSTNQPTPTDIDYSLERYNLIRRAYWVNGQREKAQTLPCPIADLPLGYVALITDNGTVVAKFVVEGKVSSLMSYLTPESEFYEQYESGARSGNSWSNEWLADVDGSYGLNPEGIFFFTPDKKYIEWTGTYLYSDIPFEIKDPVIKMESVK
jgi:hypothetical protein